jgi:hypothetical protein
MERGAPTKYYPEICQELEDWFNQEPFEEQEIPHYGKDGEIKYIEKKRHPRQLPTLINFARSKKIGLTTLYDWANENHASYQPEFSKTYKEVMKTGQKEFLIQNGIAGLWNPVFSKFVAVNMTDLKDKAEIDHTSGGEKIDNSEETLRKLAFLLRAEAEKKGE